jgi:hypothetical protein
MNTTISIVHFVGHKRTGCLVLLIIVQKISNRRLSSAVASPIHSAFQITVRKLSSTGFQQVVEDNFHARSMFRTGTTLVIGVSPCGEVE